MKTFLRISVTIIIIGAVSYGAYLFYLKNKNSKQRDALELVPSDAVFIVETSELTKGWTALKNNKMWQQLTSTSMFADINSALGFVDTLLTQNKPLQMILGGRKLMLSASMISTTDFDFAFVVEAGEVPDISLLKGALNLMDGYKSEEKDYHRVPFIELTDKANGSKIYIMQIDNLIAGTFSSNILEKMINEKDRFFWIENKQFKTVADDVRGKKLFNFYFNYNVLHNFMGTFTDKPDASVDALDASLTYSAFSIDLSDQMLTFNGFTGVDTMQSYINALSRVQTGKHRAFELLPQQTAMYVSMGFEHFADFYNSLVTEFSKSDSAGSENFDKNVRRIEKLLGVNLKEDFFSWIGSEIAVAKLQPNNSARVEDVIALIHATDIDRARTGLVHIVDQVAKRSPLRYKVTTYKNYEINFLNVNNFFKALFGNLFNKLEKPYFVFIEDYVVLSNSESAIKEIIDRYVTGQTMLRDAQFAQFRDNFSVKSNLLVYVQMPKMYELMRHFTNGETRSDLEKNKDVVLSFARLGFQLSSENGKYSNILILEHDEEAPMNEALAQMESQSDNELVSASLDTAALRQIMPADTVVKEPVFKQFFDNGAVAFECGVKNNRLHGTAKAYYNSGNLQSAIPYDNGVLDGTATFYYDNTELVKKAEIPFDEGLMHGKCVEYYSDTIPKAVLLYDEGVLDGDVQYFYPSGKIKIEGEYKKGQRHGKWKHYAEDGELIEKERWRKGNKK